MRGSSGQRVRGAFIALLTASSVLVPFASTRPAMADQGDPVLHILAGLQGFFGVASQVDDLSSMAGRIPGTGVAPADALGFADIFDDGAASATDSFVDKLSGTDVAAAIEGLEGAYGPVTVTIDGPNDMDTPLVQPNGGITDVVFKVTLDSPGRSLPVAFADDLLDISGGHVFADVSMTSSILHFQLDESAATGLDTAAEALWLLEESDAAIAGVAEAPSFTLRVAASSAAAAAFDEIVGIGGVSVDGTFDLDISLQASINEPDGAANDRITALELATTSAEDLYSIAALAPTAANAVDVTLNLRTALIGTAGDVDASIRIVDHLVDDSPPVVTLSLGEMLNFLNLRPDDLLGLVDRIAGLFDTFQGSGRFDVELPWVGGTFSDVLTLGDTLRFAAQTGLREQVDNPDTEFFNEIGQPAFTTIEEFIVDFAGLAGVTPTNLGYDATNDRITFDLAYATDASKSLPINFGSLADLTGINLGAATADLGATFAVTLPVAIDVSPLPVETGAGPLSCVDGVDNDGDTTIDAADTDCASLKTLEERITIDTSASDEATATLDLSVSGLSGSASIGILQADIDAGLDIGNVAGTGPAAAAIDLTATGDRATLPAIVSAIAGSNLNVSAAPTLDIKATGTLAVSALLGGVSLGSGNLVATAQANGAFSSVSQLVDTLAIDTTGIDSLDLVSFSPCRNGLDDDGDGVADDGCKGGPAAVADPESESLAGFDQVVAMLRGVAGQVSGLVDTLDEDVPLVGDSLGDVIDVVTPIVDLADALASGSEAAVGGCGNTDDDDYDGIVNDGCPTEGDAPEAGPACANDEDDDGDGAVNDGCPPVVPTLQQLGDTIDGLLTDALAGVLVNVADDVQVATTYDDNGTAGDKSDDLIDFKVTISAEDSKAVSLDAEFGGADIGGYELFTTETLGTVEFNVDGTATFRFGLRLSDFQPYVGGDTGVELSGRVSGDNLEFNAGLGPLTLKVGNLTAAPETGSDCEEGTSADEDKDGYANDGCPAQPDPESGAACANGTDDDGDGVVNDGCPDPPAADGDAEAGADCDGVDSDGDGTADDGCPPWPVPAAEPDGDPEEGAACDAGDTTDDDNDGHVNDGCPAQLVEPASFHLGATISLTEDGADDDEAFFLDGDTVGFGGELSGVEQTTLCGAGLVACATLPLYLEAGAQPKRLAAINIEWSDFTSAPTPTFDGNKQDIIDALAEQAIDLLLLETGIGEYIDKVSAFIADALLAFDFPLIGDQLKELADLIDPADPDEKGLLDVKNAIEAALGGSNPLEGLVDAEDIDAEVKNLAGELESALGVPVTGQADCTDDDCTGKGVADVLGVSFDLSLGEDFEETAGGFDIGIDGLGLTSSDKSVTITGGWSLDLGFGISRNEGFYIKTDTENELDINAEVGLPDKLTGMLGFLQVDIYDGHPDGECTNDTPSGCRPAGVDPEPKSEFGPQFVIDLVDDGDGKLTFGELSQGPSFGDLFAYDLTATADVNLHIETSIEGDASLPRLFTDVFLDWQWSLQDQLDPDGVGLVAPTITLENLYLDAGTFIGEFLQPVLSDVEKYTKPLDPIIEQLTTPIPVLSDFAGEPVTLITLAETFGPADNKYDLIFHLIALVDFINGIDTSGDGLLLIELGAVFDLDEDTLRQGPLAPSKARSVFDQAELASLDSGGSLVAKIDEKTGSASSSGISSSKGLADIGLTFPFLDQPSQLMGLLFGQDVDLAVFRPKPLAFGFSYSEKFGPIWAVPPVFVEIGGSSTITGRFGIGYDTQGLREVLFDDASAGALLHGLFLVDVDANGVDVNELEFEGRLFANAQVSVLIFSAGAEGSIFTTIGIDIDDPNSDGKLKFEEARDILVATGNPLCLFSLNGNFGVAIDVFAEVDLFFWSKKWTKTLADIILYMFEVKCDFDKEPKLASHDAAGNLDLDQYIEGLPDGSPAKEKVRLGDGTTAKEKVLRVNLGARRGERGAGSVGINTAAEEFVIKKEIDGSITVSAFGTDINYDQQEWDGVFLDLADAGKADDVRDVITFADNVVGGENEPIAGSSETNRCGNAVDDDGDGVVNDGCPVVDDLDLPETDADCSNEVDDDGDGRVNEGCPKVEVAVPFDLSVVIVNGSDGPDRITGGHGGHYIETGPGNDQVSTKESNDYVNAGTGNDQVGTGDGDDTIIGGPDDAGDAEDDDSLDGGPGADTIDGGDGADTINGGLTVPAQPAQNILEQPDGADTISGGPGADTIDGGPANDVIDGGAGADRISGDEGNDEINGGDETSTCDADGDDRTLDDVLVGGPGEDTIHGDDGDDIIVGGNLTSGDADTGDTLLDGDDGCDLVLGDNGVFTDPQDPYAFAIPTDGVGGDDAIEGGSGADELHGQIGNDTILGEAGKDLMFGEDANDDMDGGAGEDVMYGDAGIPSYAAAGDDTVVGGDDNDRLFGEAGQDVLLGDRGTVDRSGTGDREDDTVTLEGGNGEDFMRGGLARDVMFGQDGNDAMFGDSGQDLMFGNEGTDEMHGGLDADRMVGGSRVAGGADGWDTMRGGGGSDVMAGDNAAIADGVTAAAKLVTLHYDGAGAGDSMSGDAAGDSMFGDAAGDRMFGQAGDDRVFGGSGDDYAEGNEGTDTIEGGDGADDLIGGSSSSAGEITASRIGTGRPDTGDTIYGADAAGLVAADLDDVIAGDNARIDRAFILDTTGSIVLFDVNSASTTVSGGDYVYGGDGADLIFGQGNGSQPGSDTDPADQVGAGPFQDNDLSGAADEDGDLGDGTAPGSTEESGTWLGDALFGGPGDDVIEGNHGADLIRGGADNDVLVGGGSADEGDGTGVIDADREGTGLFDEADTIHGDAGDDVLAGDNARVGDAPERLVTLFDVNSTDAAVSAGDYLAGGPGADELFGQGNGDQLPTQQDPVEGFGNDNDGDGEDGTVGNGNVPWHGDYLLGGAGTDYLEGNHGADLLLGGPDDDDLIGGGSANDGNFAGVIDADREGTGLLDAGDIMYGEGGDDYLAGDNARIVPSDGTNDAVLTLGDVRDVVLWDVESTGGPAISKWVSGGDYMAGGADDDVMFGQGNGLHSVANSDPLDGVDNDRNGREDPLAADIGYDCEDGTDNDGDTLVDAADPPCLGDIDENVPWAGDFMLGGGGDDYMEGNHGSDWMFGGDEEDDMAGGGSSLDGVIDADRAVVDAARPGEALLDGHDVMHGDAEDDVMAGDNATINRVLDGGGTAWVRLDGGSIASAFGPYDQAVRITEMAQSPEPAGAFGDDWIAGDDGNDEMYGQLGDDFVRGDLGDDALVGDLGQVTANLLGDGVDDPDLDVPLASNSPRWAVVINETGSMQWKTELYSSDTDRGGLGGDDVLLGYDGRDTLFGGPGDDIINGDGDGTHEFLDPDNPEFSHIVDPTPGSDVDFIFGGDDDDVIWGGRDNDVAYGGYGDDHLDVRPRVDWDNGKKGKKLVMIAADPPEWFTYGFPENFQDVDFIYGGWDRDALQADQAANGPNPGDRLADWAGGFNVFYICPSGYGDFNITRSGGPDIREFLQMYAEASGAMNTAVDGSSGFREVAYVFNNQRGRNSHPPHPDHVAHFTCVDFVGS